MIVTSVQIKTAKTQKHLYCPVFTICKKTAFRYCGEPFFSCQNILTQKSSEMIGAFGLILHLRKLCKFCFQCRIDLCVKLVVFLILRYSLCFRLLYLVGLYYCLTSFRY